MTQKFKGLSDEQVILNREKFGSNLLTPPKKDPLWKLFLEKFRDPIIQVLLVAAVLSLIISVIHHEYSETIGIFCAILLATGVSFWFEMDANKKFDLLNQINDDTQVKVIRNTHFIEIPKKDLVVGDIVLLDTGDEIPADGVLRDAISLRVNESTLTGEPSIAKTTDEAHFNKEATYPSNRLYRGTTIVEGHCTMEISAVGDATEFGKVAIESTAQTGEETPLGKQLSRLGKLISVIGFTVGILTFLALFIKDIFIAPGLYTSGDWLGIAARLLRYFMVAVTLIVVCVPEGLPMSVTLSLALSMRRMLKTNNLVRKMHACETMGAATVICTDKTGTLTQNRMKVKECYFWGKQFQEDSINPLIIENISCNSTAFLDTSDEQKLKLMGNPTEAALLLWLHKNKLNYLKYREESTVLEQIPFGTEHKYMATLVYSPTLQRKILYIKGAPEIVYNMCDQAFVSEDCKCKSLIKDDLFERLSNFQNQAMRTLAFAYKEVDAEDNRSIGELLQSELTFVGITAIADPVREDVPDAVKTCLEAGIKVKIITGDTPGTAKEIGRQIGIWSTDEDENHLISGIEFANLSDEEALQRVQEIKIMCRARPMDKQRMVQLLQQCGEIVAVTGDGTNDAPALNFANVGLSMGSGTSVAKEASDITLLDDSFRSIATAVMWGRSLYKNIQRFLFFQLTINLTALIIVFLGSFFGQELPLTVTQMLWVNLIMDTFAAAALASLPPDKAVMKDKPRENKAFIITRKMAVHIFVTSAVFIIALITLLYIFTYQDFAGISVYKLSCFFTVFVMLQFWNMFNAKAFDTGRSAFYKMKESKAFLLVAGIILFGQFIIVTFGGEVFRTVPLSWQDWGIIIAASSLILWIGEILRMRKTTQKARL